MKIKNVIVYVLIVLIFPLMCNGHSLAYKEYFTDSFPVHRVYVATSDPIQYIVHEGFSDVSFSHMNSACYRWNQATSRTLVSRNPTLRHNLTGFGSGSSGDSLSLVYRKAVSDGYIALNSFTIHPNDYHITDSDINFNMNKRFANSAQPDRWDTYSIFLHEVGHTIGLDDIYSPQNSDEADAVML